MSFIIIQEDTSSAPHQYRFDDLIVAVKKRINELSAPCTEYPNCCTCHDAGKYNHCLLNFTDTDLVIRCRRCMGNSMEMNTIRVCMSYPAYKRQAWGELAEVVKGLDLPRYMIGDMSSRHLSSFMVDALGSANNLKVLEMKSQELTKPNFDFLCSVVAKSRTLEQLHLSGCYAEESSLDEFPSKYRSLAEAIGASSSLRILRLSEMDMITNGFLADLFAGSAHKLEKFIFTYNMEVSTASMKAIREALEHPECKIQQLNLSGMEDANFTLVAKGLERNSSLKELTLSHSDQRFEDEVNALVEALSLNSKLEKIELCSNRSEHPDGLLSQQGWNQFFRGLKDAKGLRHIDISGIDFTVEMTQSFISGLQGNESITHITMQDIEVEAQGFDLLGDITQTRSLKFLDISNCRRGMTDSFFRGIGQSLENNTGLEVLKMSNITIDGPHGFKPVINALAKNTTLRELDVSGCREDHLLREVTEALTQNHQLTKLTLKNFLVSVDDFQYFSESMAKMKGIETIIFGQLHHTMAVAFLNGLKKNTSLKNVDGTLGDESCWRMIDFYLRLNRGGRKSLMLSPRFPSSLLPKILSRSTKDADVLYSFLQEVELNV